MTTLYTPLKQKERIELIDALRGFALLGILMVNIQYMYEPMSQIMIGAKPTHNFLQIISQSFIKFFFEGKFYVIFSMLFGFGFWIFLQKNNDQTRSIIPVYRRRLFFLLLFGLAHIVLLWMGDVLIFYSLFGFLLILYKKSSTKKILIWAVILVFLPTVLNSLMVLMVTYFSQIPEAKAAIDAQFTESMRVTSDLVQRATVIYSSGSFTEIVSIRIEEYLTLLGGSLFFFCPVILSMFLLGFLAARKGLVANYRVKLPLFRKIFWWGLAVGVVTNTLYTIAYQNTIMSLPNGWSLISTAMHMMGGVSLGLCYVAGITILFIKGKSGGWIKYFVPIGRMALTNYLLQSLIAVLLFHSYGLGLYNRVAVWQGIFLTVVIFVLQIIFSRWWLVHYQFGPMEWLWRSLTYMKIQPFKRVAKKAVAA